MQRHNLTTLGHWAVVVVCGALASGCGESSPPAPANGGPPKPSISSGEPSTEKPAEEVPKIDLSGVDKSLSGSIKIDGSSTVYKISQAAAEEFGKVASDVNISVAAKGTGGGMKEFVKGNLDICDASRPITSSEIALCQENDVEFIELPIAFDAITVVVHPKNTWLESITTAKLKEIWEPSAKDKKKWKDFDPSWPDKDIHLFGADPDSGTWEYFTEAIMGKKGEIRTDYTNSANDNVIIKGVEGDQYAMGFVPFAYFAPRSKTMKALKLDAEKEGGPGAVMPKVDTVKDGTYAPLSRPLFIYVRRKAADRPEVKSFVDFYVKNGKAISMLAKYIALPTDSYPKISARFSKLETGTAFEGKPKFGIHIDQVLELPLK